MTTKEIASRLVANSRAGDHFANYSELFAEEAISIEPYPNPKLGVLKQTDGLSAIIKKANVFHALIDKVYSREISDPLVSGDRFAVVMKQEFELKGMGKLLLDELCIFLVRDGKIVFEEYFF